MGPEPGAGLALLTAESYFGRGVSSPERLLERARALGHTHLALTDWRSLTGGVRFFRKAQELGLKSLLGAGLPLATPEGTFPVLLLAGSREGYARLSAHLSRALAEGSLPLAALLEDNADLVLLTGGREGFPSRLLSERRLEALDRLLKTLEAAFRDRLFLALYHARLPGDDRRVRILRALAQDRGLPYVPALEVRQATPELYPLLDALTCARLGLGVEQPHPGRPRNEAQALPSKEEALDRIPFPEAWANARALAEGLAFPLLPERMLDPPVPLPPGRTPQEELTRLAQEALRRRYPQRPAYQARLQEELATVEALGLAGFFLLAHQVVAWARSRGILAVARGSAVGSLLAHLLDLTPVDPVAEGLLFERFLHGGMKALPDIDLDLSSRRRQEVIRHLEETYGAQEAMAAAYVTYRLPLAVQDLGRALGLPAELRHRLTRALGRDFRHLPPHRAQEAEPLFREVLGEAPVKGLLLRLLALMEKGHVRHLMPHVGGVVVAPGPLTRYAPVVRSAGGIQMLTLDKDDLEALGLVKLDLLGLRMLSALERAREEVFRSEGVWLDLEGLPQEEAVYRPLWRGETLGVFQLESPAQTAMSRRLRPKTLEDLAQQIALVRPGPIQSGTVRPYLERRLGRERSRPLHPVLQGLFSKTHGVLLFQEQLLSLLHHGAGMGWAEAEAFRKALSKAQDEEDLKPLRERFLEGLRATLGLEGEEAMEVWRLVEGFRGYGFTESHAQAFARHAYASLWLKAHHPAAFLAGLLSEAPGMWPPATLRQEARRLGVPLLPLSVNRSGLHYRVEVARGVKALRLPLTAAKGVSEDFARAILQQRLRGPFRSLEDFRARLEPPEDVLLALVKAGAFDELHGRREALFRAGLAPEGPLLSEAIPPPPLPPLHLGERLRLDLEAKGLSELPLHPLDLLRGRLEELGATPIPLLRPGPALTAGLVVARQKPPTAKGHAFYVLEDGPHRLQAVIPPEVWARRYRVFRDARILLVQGVYTGASLRVEEAWPLKDV
ncbi:DNA polymerase III subunit alpha [Thermus tengchongensis]|uniref:DNA-directed DNA polymerase n=1 Tax=Thermus tengchongensis TaxID=1214928 RepID=A0ABY2K7Y3_9DEIN|nr:DNA polymerase III subunit alpha [Thermus tengchongensis]TFU14821.1 DNA polymerase III subunit alpha [Thermus tengchongensis]